ncbi:hypothetical protein LOD99_7747 [Oopsacas minuta]|uniref:YHYH domain-containing protein n=1 Tax=Oopsacas minuta TaxID=111878 RepID=A0AAV7JQS3_9METZ|nr:hypothetical protein LOD99_7747 [Oopsacas minuta]
MFIFAISFLAILHLVTVQSIPAGHSPKVGYAFDGYPVYGPYTDGGGLPTDLDICNGRNHPSLGYLYHTTVSAPYTFGCYAGEVLCANFNMNAPAGCLSSPPSSGATSLTCTDLGLISGVSIKEVPWTVIETNVPSRVRCTVESCASTAPYCWHTNNTANTAYTSSINCVENGNRLKITANGVPNHFIGKFPMSESTYHLNRPSDNPNSLSEQSFTWYIPKYPIMKSVFPTQSIVTDVNALPFGPTGFAINSVPFFNMYNMGMLDAVDGSEGFEVLDMCLGHPQMFGAYHYHTTPHCLINELNGVTNAVSCGNSNNAATSSPNPVVTNSPNSTTNSPTITLVLLVTLLFLIVLFHA